MNCMLGGTLRSQISSGYRYLTKYLMYVKLQKMLFTIFSVTHNSIWIIAARCVVHSFMLWLLLHHAQTPYRTIPVFCLGDILVLELLEELSAPRGHAPTAPL